jgi:transcriptional regulator with XRE-family HTH domain
MSITSAQSRAGRGWLSWTQADLAARAHVGLSTVRDFEADRRAPVHNNITAIRRALEEGGGADLLKATDGLAAPATEAMAGASEDLPAKTRSRAKVQGKRSGSGAGGRRGKQSPRSTR